MNASIDAATSTEQQSLRVIPPRCPLLEHDAKQWQERNWLHNPAELTLPPAIVLYSLWLQAYNIYAHGFQALATSVIWLLGVMHDTHGGFTGGAGHHSHQRA